MVGKTQGSGLNREFHTSQEVENAGWNWAFRASGCWLTFLPPEVPPENSVAFKISPPARDQAFKTQLNGEHFRLKSGKEDQRWVSPKIGKKLSEVERLRILAVGGGEMFKGCSSRKYNGRAWRFPWHPLSEITNRVFKISFQKAVINKAIQSHLFFYQLFISVGTISYCDP